MKELVEVIAKSLVDFPDEVVVTETESEKGTRQIQKFRLKSYSNKEAASG